MKETISSVYRQGYRHGYADAPKNYDQGYLDGYRAAHQKALDMFKSWLDDRSHLQ